MARPYVTKVTYIACDATSKAEPNVLVAVYRFILDCRARKEAAHPAAPKDAKEVQVTLAPRPFYIETPKCLITLFDLRCPGAEERLHRERAAWRGFAYVERLTADCGVLIVQPGGATELPA
jgi:hypothetical protein